VDFEINQIKDTITGIDKTLGENDKILKTLQDSISQLSLVSREVSDYVSQVLNNVKGDNDDNGLQITVSALLEIRKHLDQKPTSVSNSISSISASSRTLLEIRKREEFVIESINAHREKIDNLKEEILDGSEIKRSIGNRPESLKDIRQAKSELLNEE